MGDSINIEKWGSPVHRSDNLPAPARIEPRTATHEHCHIPQNYDTQENWLTDQHRNQRHRHVDSPSSEIAATRQPVSLSAQDIDVSFYCLISYFCSDLNAAAAAPSQTKVTDLNCSDHSTTLKWSGKLSLLCTGLPHFSIFILSPILSIV